MDLVYAFNRAANPFLIPGTGIVSGTPGGRACNGTLVRKKCSLRSATLEYPITLVNSTVHLAENTTDFNVVDIQAFGNETNWNAFTADLNPMSHMTLGGVAMAAQNMFSSVAAQTWYTIQMTGSLASQYADYGVGNSTFFTSQDACAINFRDPSNDIMDALNEIMFRTSLKTANFSNHFLMFDGLNSSHRNYYEAYPVTPKGVGPFAVPLRPTKDVPASQILQTVQTSEVPIFRSNYSYLAAALSIMTFGVMVVIPTFHGFWEL